MRPTPPPPTYATPRDPQAKTYGPWVDRVASFLGTPLMPWQRQVVDTALEVDPARPGAFKYKKVILTVPRQSGKTTLLRALSVARALTCPMEIWYTAQTRKAAVKKWHELADPLPTMMGYGPDGKPRADLKKGVGNEFLYFWNGSLIAPFAPKKDGLDSITSPLVEIDEAFAFSLEAGLELLASAEPVGITFPDAQIWIVSTAGHQQSTWLKQLVEQGRAATKDPNASIAYFEWSADPELAAKDPYSPETLAFHPALDYTQDLRDLLKVSKATSLSVWRRAYLNLWSNETAAVIDPAAWDALEDSSLEMPDPARVAIGCAVAADRSAASIWGAWHEEGNIAIHQLATKDGAAWLEPALEQIMDEKQILTLGGDDAGLTRVALQEMAQNGYPVKRLTPREWATACTWFIGAVEAGEIRHDGAQLITKQLAAAQLRPLGGATAFSENHSAGPIDGLKAAIVAAYLTHLSGEGGTIF